MKSPQAKREQAIRQLAKCGMPDRKIAKRLGLSIEVVRSVLAT